MYFRFISRPIDPTTRPRQQLQPSMMNPCTTSILVLLTVIIHELDVVGVVVVPAEAEAPLSVDPSTELPAPVAFQGLEPIAGGDRKSIRAAAAWSCCIFARASVARRAEIPLRG